MKKVINFLRTKPTLRAAIILIFFLLIFLSHPILTRGYFAPADSIRWYDPFINGSRPHNPVLIDVTLQFLPWFKLSRELLDQGFFPLWNIYEGGGLPHLANMQSAVLFPLSIFFYLFNFKLALLAYTFGKLLLIGIFTFLFLRELRCSFFVALAGGLGFMFGNFNIIWLFWPHTNCVFLLPAGLYLIEHYFNHKKEINFLWLSLAVAAGIFAGHPETFGHISLVLFFYFFYRLFSVRFDWKEDCFIILKFTASFMLGLGLAAALLGPFFEYLRYSAVFLGRSGHLNRSYLPRGSFILNFIPDFFGFPVIKSLYFLKFPYFYIEIATGYVGVSLIFLALYSAGWLWRQKIVPFFIVLALLSLGIIYRIPIIFNLFTKLPFFRISNNGRLLLIFSLALIVLGSLALENIIRAASRPTRNKIVLSAVIFLMVVLAAALLGFLKRSSLATPLMNSGPLLGIILIIFLINLLITLMLLFWINLRWVKIIFILLIFLETGGHGISYNTTTKKENFYPFNRAVAWLQKDFSNGYYKTFVRGRILHPDLGTWYHIDQFNDYDAIGLASYENLKKMIGPLRKGSFSQIDKINNFEVLTFLGVKNLVFERDLGLDLIKKRSRPLTLVYQDDRVVILTEPAFPRAYLVPGIQPQEIDKKLTNLLAHPDLRQILPVKSFHLFPNGDSYLTYSTSTPGCLVLNENYYPGWQAKIDHSSIIVFNGLGLKVIAVPAGNHQVSFRYRPASFKLGLGISLVSLMVWLSLFFFRPRV